MTMQAAERIARLWRNPPSAETPPLLRQTYLQSLNLSERQLRLFGVGCWWSPPILEQRRRNSPNNNPLSRLVEAIEMAERCIDGEVTRSDIKEQFDTPFGFTEPVFDSTVEPNPLIGAFTSCEAAYGLGARPYHDHERVYQGVLLAGIVAPGWECRSDWRTEITQSIARAIYQNHSFGGMQILADALEESGCDNNDWLSLLRMPLPGHNFLHGNDVDFLRNEAPWPWCRGCRIIDDLR